MTFRKATKQDIEAVAEIYSDIHTEEEQGTITVGWERDIYPTTKTAELALQRGDLYVEEDEGYIVGAAIINQQQVEEYRSGAWSYDAPDDEIMVLHTLVISPKTSRKGYGAAFVRFYEEHALSCNCHYLRMDTNEKNSRARAMYEKLGYKIVGYADWRKGRFALMEKVL